MTELKQTDNCPICKSQAKYLPQNKETSHITCSRCGEFFLSDRLIAHFCSSEYSDKQRRNISSWIFERPGVEIQPEEIANLTCIIPPTIKERAEKLLLFLAEKFPKIGKEFKLGDYIIDGLLNDLHNNYASYLGLIDELKDYPNQLLSVSWCQDIQEFFFLLINYLSNQQKFIEFTDLNEILINPKGWEYIERLKTLNPKSNIAFVAMWFDPSTNELFNRAIEPAIEAAGFKALRIDRFQHNNRIDDEIIAGIKRSKFLVCDFTNQRPGVYFESGFGLGFGLQVIWTCKKNEIEENKIHFDNRQYNFLTWEEGKLEDFKKALQNRIEATIGRA